MRRLWTGVGLVLMLGVLGASGVVIHSRGGPASLLASETDARKLRAPEGVRIKTGKNILARDVDVRGEGGFLVLPPSIHPSGRPYEWIEGLDPATTEIAACPDWLLPNEGELGYYRMLPKGNLLVSGNGAVTANGNIQVDDGVLDCCIFSPQNLRDAIRIMWRVTRRDFRPDRSILYRKGTRFRLETEPVLSLQADGELLGTTPADVTVEPLAAHLLVPRR